jgi:hypothetical protein
LDPITSLWEIQTTEEHIKLYHGDVIGKIQVNQYFKYIDRVKVQINGTAHALAYKRLWVQFLAQEVKKNVYIYIYIYIYKEEKNRKGARHQWLTPIILATQGAEIRRTAV